MTAETAAAQAPRSTGPSSGRSRPTPTADGFALAGPSDPPDPLTNAYRKDLADAALAGRVIASHYAEPVPRTIHTAATLRKAPAAEADAILELTPGTAFDLLDDSVGWAWGYAGEDRIVGYVQSSALS